MLKKFSLTEFPHVKWEGINGQSVFRQEMLSKIDKLESKVDQGFEEVNKRIDGTHERMDKIGKQLAYLEDDAPTREEFDQIDKRVGKLEHKIALAA